MTTNHQASRARRAVATAWLMVCACTIGGVQAQTASKGDKATTQEPGVAKKVGGAVERGVKAAASGVERGVAVAASGVRRAGNAVGRGAEAAGSAANKGARKIGVPTDGASAPKR